MPETNILRIKKKYLAIASLWIVYFLIIAITILPHGFQTKFSLDNCNETALAKKEITCLGNGIPVTAVSSLQQLKDYYGGSDPANYMKGGEELISRGYDFRDYWATNLWPPGMFTLHALRIKLAPAVPPIIALAAVLSTLWASVFLLLFIEMSRSVRLVIASLIPLALIALPLFSHYIFGLGVVMSEPYAIALLSTVGLLLLQGIRRKNLCILLLAGPIAACAALFRTQADMIMIFTMIAIAAFAVIALIFQLYATTPRKVFYGFFACALLFFSLTGMYRWYNKHGMVHMDYAWAVPFQIPENTKDTAWQSVIDGGMDTVCQAEPKTCARIKRRLDLGEWVQTQELRKSVIHAIIHHPLFVTKYKGRILARYWFSANTDVSNKALGDHILENGLYLAFILGAMAVGFVHRHSLSAFIISAFAFCAAAGCIIPSLPMHFEVRFLFIAKAIGCILFLCALSLDLSAESSYLRRTKFKTLFNKSATVSE